MAKRSRNQQYKALEVKSAKLPQAIPFEVSILNWRKREFFALLKYVYKIPRPQ